MLSPNAAFARPPACDPAAWVRDDLSCARALAQARSPTPIAPRSRPRADLGSGARRTMTRAIELLRQYAPSEKAYLMCVARRLRAGQDTADTPSATAGRGLKTHLAVRLVAREFVPWGLMSQALVYLTRHQARRAQLLHGWRPRRRTVIRRPCAASYHGPPVRQGPHNRRGAGAVAQGRQAAYRYSFRIWAKSRAHEDALRFAGLRDAIEANRRSVSSRRDVFAARDLGAAVACIRVTSTPTRAVMRNCAAVRNLPVAKRTASVHDRRRGADRLELSLDVIAVAIPMLVEGWEARPRRAGVP